MLVQGVGAAFVVGGCYEQMQWEAARHVVHRLGPHEPHPRAWVLHYACYLATLLGTPISLEPLVQFHTARALAGVSGHGLADTTLHSLCPPAIFYLTTLFVSSGTSQPVISILSCLPAYCLFPQGGCRPLKWCLHLIVC